MRRVGLLLIGKGAVSADWYDWTRGVGLDESEQRPSRGAANPWLLLSTDAGVSAHT